MPTLHGCGMLQVVEALQDWSLGSPPPYPLGVSV
jgi:hypothetical protein